MLAKAHSEDVKNFLVESLEVPSEFGYRKEIAQALMSVPSLSGLDLLGFFEALCAFLRKYPASKNPSWPDEQRKAVFLPNLRERMSKPDNSGLEDVLLVDSISASSEDEDTSDANAEAEEKAPSRKKRKLFPDGEQSPKEIFKMLKSSRFVDLKQGRQDVSVPNPKTPLRGRNALQGSGEQKDIVWPLSVALASSPVPPVPKTLRERMAGSKLYEQAETPLDVSETQSSAQKPWQQQTHISPVQTLTGQQMVRHCNRPWTQMTADCADQGNLVPVLISKVHCLQPKRVLETNANEEVPYQPRVNRGSNGVSCHQCKRSGKEITYCTNITKTRTGKVFIIHKYSL